MRRLRIRAVGQRGPFDVTSGAKGEVKAAGTASLGAVGYASGPERKVSGPCTKVSAAAKDAGSGETRGTGIRAGSTSGSGEAESREEPYTVTTAPITIGGASAGPAPAGARGRAEAS